MRGRVIKFRPLKPSDFYEIEAQPRHQRLLTWLRANPLSIRHMTEDPFSYTMEVDGRAVATGGTTLDNEIWALMGGDMRRTLLPFTRYSRAMIEQHGPCWAAIDRTVPSAVRWAKALRLRLVHVDQTGTMDKWAYLGDRS
jgi:hypothetical protein